MKFKLDENLDPRLISLIQEGAHDVETVSSEGLSGSSDETVYEVCIRESRILITLDLDFSNPFRFPPAPTAGIVVVSPPRPTIPQNSRYARGYHAELERSGIARQALDS